jgi:ribosomal protein L6P/L9E
MFYKELVFIRRKERFFIEDLKNVQSSDSFFLSANLGSNSFQFPFNHVINYNKSTCVVFYPHNKRAITSTLVKNVKLFLKGLIQGFFLEFRIIGLGFRVKRSGFFQTRSLRFDIGFSHLIRIVLPKRVRIGRVKKRFFIFCNDWQTINIFTRQVKLFKILNPYKLRGLRPSDLMLKMKQGKKQTKR